MSEEFRQCTTCDGVIDRTKDLGRLRWYHCEKCGAWSLRLLAPADAPTIATSGAWPGGRPGSSGEGTTDS